MSTNCNIMITSDHKTFASAYVHWDGGLWGVGQMLNKEYNDTDKILDLIALGQISSLKETVEETATDSHNAYKTIAGEVEMKDVKEVFIPSAGEEYIYCWEAKQEKWYVGTYYTSTPNWRLLTDAVKEFLDEVPAKTIFGEDYDGVIETDDEV